MIKSNLYAERKVIKKWEEADKIRKKIEIKEYSVEDTSLRVKIHKVRHPERSEGSSKAKSE